MGLWDKVKGAVQTMTGGGAKVNVEVAQATLGQPFLVRVIAEAKANLELSEVYLQVRSVERAEVRDVDYDYGDHRQRIEYVQGSHIAFNQRFAISGKQTLSEGETQVWEAEITIPESENPSFDGHIICHQWEIMGALDTFGNDPDSGWLTFEVWDN